MTSIAVLGANGVLSQPIFDALSSSPFSEKVKYPIKVITRSTDGKTDSEKLKFIAATGVAAYTEIFKSVDVVVNVAGLGPVFEEVLKAVISAKPKLYIPSQFGGDTPNLTILPGLLQEKELHSKKARDAGVKVVDIYTGAFFGGPWLTQIVGNFGVDITTNSVNYIGDPDSPVSASSLVDIGKVVAVIVTSDPSSLPDQIRVYSDVVSQRIVAERYSTINNVKLTETFMSDEELKKQIQEKYFDGFSFEHLFFYLQVMVSQGEGKGGAFSNNNSRELVNPGESLFKWTKY